MIINYEKLPAKIISRLKSIEGVRFTRGCFGDLAELDLIDSQEGVILYKEFLLKGENIDQGIQPTFGSPLNPCVNVNVQTEVHGLLFTFRPLLKAAFEAGGALPAYAAGPGHAPGGYIYHNSQSVHAVIDEICTPTPYAAACPFLSDLPIGNLICHISITYANCMVLMKLSRSA